MTFMRLKALGSTGFGATLTDAETGAEIKGISRISVEILPADITRIEAELFSSEIDVGGEVAFYVADPITGETKQPARIEFRDGSVWTAD